MRREREKEKEGFVGDCSIVCVVKRAYTVPTRGAACHQNQQLGPAVHGLKKRSTCVPLDCLTAGVRVITSDRHQLLRRVPPAAASVLEIGSTSPGALLYDARRLFDAQDARATGE